MQRHRFRHHPRRDLDDEADNSKTYGDADPSLLTTGGSGDFLAADNVTATYSRGSRVRRWRVGRITSRRRWRSGGGARRTTRSRMRARASPSICGRRPGRRTDSSKTYGDADPSLLTTGSGGNFVVADNVTATYSRAAGETVAGGAGYHITATLTRGGGWLTNYTITNAGAELRHQYAAGDLDDDR